MSIKIGILTTNTPHHTYFVKEILKHYNDIKVFSETGKIKSQSFKTFHSFERKTREYEIKKWFNGKKTNLDDIVDTINFSSLNDNSAIQEIKKYNPELIIVFGTRPLKPKVLEINPDHSPIIGLSKVDITDSNKKGTLKEVSDILLDQAKILEGIPLEDSKLFCDNVNELLIKKFD